MEFMNKGNFAESAKLLLKANQILTNLTPTYSVIKLKAVTLNNLGCVYKRGEDNTKALHYLAQALEYEKKLPEEYTNIAGTHLNLCAIKSHLSDHNSALDHALAAVNIIQRNYTGKHEFITTLVAAYHNAGIEYQYLNRKIEANNFFRQGLDMAVKHLGRNHTLTRNIESMMPKNFYNDFTSSPNVSIDNKKARAQAVFNPESRIFEAEKKIKVDTTPWPKFTDKKTWPSKIDPIAQVYQNEITPKPKVKYPKHVRSEYNLETPPYPKFPERPLFNPSELDSDDSSIAPVRVPSKSYVPKRNLNQSLSERKRDNVHLHHQDSNLTRGASDEKTQINKGYLAEKPRARLDKDRSSDKFNLQHSEKKPSNVHLHHDRQNFRISNKPQPKSTQSLNSSPSKSTVSGKSIALGQHPSTNYIKSQITAEKISQLSSKLENLQEKLNHFEENYQVMNTLEEVKDDESVISTLSVVNNKRNSAAIFIQKHFRRFLVQKRFKDMKKATVKIQKVRRGVNARKKVRQEFFKFGDFSQQVEFEPLEEPVVVKTEEKSNQTDIPSRRKVQGQIVLVSKQGIRAVKKRRTLLDNIVIIQAHIRGFLGKRKWIRIKKAVKVIQRAFKSFRIRSIFRKIVSAIVFIQSAFRGYKARKFTKSILPKGVFARVQSCKRW